MSRNRILPEAARQISNACLISMLYAIILLLQGAPETAFPILLIVYSLVNYLGNVALAKKTHTIGQVTGINAVFGVCVFAAFLLVGRFPAFWQIAFGFLAIAIITVTGAVAAYNGVSLNSILLSLDANILFLIFVILLLTTFSRPFSWALFSIAGALAGLTGAVSMRSDRTPGRREWGVLLFLCLMLALLAWLLFTFVVSPLSSGAVGLGKDVAAFFVFLWGQINRFLKFIASLFPVDESVDPVEMEAPALGPGGEEAAESIQDNGILPALIVGAILLAVVLVLIYVFRRTRRNRIAGQMLQARTKEEQTKRNPFKDAFRIWMERIRRKIRAARYLSAHKKSPEGIYFRLRKICLRTLLSEQPGDTPAGFLLRIREAMEADRYQTAAGQIEELTVQLNRNFYSAHPEEVVYPWAGKLIADVRRMARKQKKTEQQRLKRAE